MSDTAATKSYGAFDLSCTQTIRESKYTDALLVTSFVAFLILGILATTGIFQCLGTTNAAYLSYGMYAGAALFLIAEIIKLAINCSKKTDDSDSSATSTESEIKPSATPTKSEIKPSISRLSHPQVTKSKEFNSPSTQSSTLSDRDKKTDNSDRSATPIKRNIKLSDSSASQSSPPSAIEREEFNLPPLKPGNVSDQDWPILSGLDLNKEVQAIQKEKKKSGIDSQFIKISRTTYKALAYSYLLNKSGELFRCTHKTSKDGSNTEDAIGKGSYKTAYLCYDGKNNSALVRAVVQDLDAFNQMSNFQEACQQYGNDPYLIPGSPHLYHNAKSGAKKLVFYTPKKQSLNKAVVSFTHPQQISVFRQLLIRIAQIHADGGAHRDIKLENLFIDINPTTQEVELFVLDFDTYIRQDNTSCVGTFQFIPCEFWGRDDITLKEWQTSDVYAVAFIAVAMFGRLALYNFMFTTAFPRCHVQGNLYANLWKNEIDQAISALQNVYKKRPPTTDPDYICWKYIPLILGILKGTPGYRNSDQLLRKFDAMK
jgi:hypothetical protein